MSSKVELLICCILYALIGNVFILLLIAFCLLAGLFCFVIKMVHFTDFIMRPVEQKLKKFDRVISRNKHGNCARFMRYGRGRNRA